MQEEKSTNNKSCYKRRSGWTEGAVLIVLGIIFLYHNFSGNHIHHWWAFLILIPAVSSFIKVWTIVQDNNGRFTSAIRKPLLEGMVLTFIALVFLKDWDWGNIWPVFLIIGGIGALISANLDKDSKKQAD